VAELVRPDRPVVCATGGHGELAPGPPAAPAPAVDRPHWAALAGRLARDGARLEPLGALAGEVPAHCRVLVVFGPRVRFRAADALAVARYLERGGRLLFLAAAPAAGEPWPVSGLEPVLAEYGVEVAEALAVDPANEIDLPWAWLALSTYSDHPIAAPFQDRRPTVWQRVRVVDWDPARAARPGVSGRALIATSAAGWGETRADAAAPAGPDADDRPGPVAIAVAVEAVRSAGPPTRLVVVGSARSLSSALDQRQLGVDDLFGAAALAWLAGLGEPVAIGDKTPPTLRLVMTRGQRAGVFTMVVVVIPLALAAVGALLWWRRRGD
jgi:hypothetical protein